MSASKKPLPPPSNHGLTTLLSRFSSPEEAESTPAAAPEESSAPPDRLTETRTEAKPARKKKTAKPATPAKPGGMARPSWYMKASTAAVLTQAVDRMVAATGGRVRRHEALDAIITAGVEQADRALDELRQAVRADIG